MAKVVLLVFSFILIFLVSCKNDPLKIDSSNVKVSIDYYNMDSVFVYAKGKDLEKWNKLFKKEINEGYEFELGMGLRIGVPEDSVILKSIELFANDPGMQLFEKQIEKKFPNLIDRHRKIVKGFQNLKFHLSDVKIPKAIIYANTCFQSSAFSTQNEIVIGLERYLGKDEPLIQELPRDIFYDWIKEGMEDKYLERDAVCSWIMSNVVQMVEANLAENMVNWGKIIYFTEAAFPDENEEIIIRYSAEDLKWAKENEFSLWSYLVKEKMLFRINETESINMLAPGPFTIGLPEKGPDRLGQYLGWQMVRKYMEKNDITLKQLQKTPYNKILQAYEID
jgi:hypothetical protein|tara:strand:- start:13520 stop:14527 length:1008 start_codon:yes stop_codon:yes gene_type:complete